MTSTAIEEHSVVSEAEWLEARRALLAKEKALTRQRDAISAERRRLPWVRVQKGYLFDTIEGPKTLVELFSNNSQLIVYHFMWRHDLGEGCVGCSYLADHLDGVNLHLHARDVTLVVSSRAPLKTLQAFRKRMGWKFDWVSSDESDFNFDYHVSFRPEELASGEVDYNYTRTKASIDELSGISIFYKNGAGEIFHTYSSYGRGSEEVLGTYMYSISYRRVVMKSAQGQIWAFGCGTTTAMAPAATSTRAADLLPKRKSAALRSTTPPRTNCPSGECRSFGCFLIHDHIEGEN